MHGTWERGNNSEINVEARMSSLLESNSGECKEGDCPSLAALSPCLVCNS